MCITKKELESKVQELRGLKTMKEELENELKAVEREIISYMIENEIDTEITDTAKITYKPQSRTTLDKDKHMKRSASSMYLESNNSGHGHYKQDFKL